VTSVKAAGKVYRWNSAAVRKRLLEIYRKPIYGNESMKRLMNGLTGRLSCILTVVLFANGGYAMIASIFLKTVMSAENALS
jgi:hypothetical protein